MSDQNRQVNYGLGGGTTTSVIFPHFDDNAVFVHQWDESRANHGTTEPWNHHGTFGFMWLLLAVDGPDPHEDTDVALTC